MPETKLRINDKIIVLNGKDPLKFAFADDPEKLLYLFDDDGNALYTGESIDD